MFAIFTSQKGRSEEKKLAAEIISRHRLLRALMSFYFVVTSPFIDKLAFHEKLGEELHRSHRALTHASAKYLRRLLDVFYADNI